LHHEADLPGVQDGKDERVTGGDAFSAGKVAVIWYYGFREWTYQTI
jgi:hypothetical protein